MEDIPRGSGHSFAGQSLGLLRIDVAWRRSATDMQMTRVFSTEPAAAGLPNCRQLLGVVPKTAYAGSIAFPANAGLNKDGR